MGHNAEAAEEFAGITVEDQMAMFDLLPLELRRTIAFSPRQHCVVRAVSDAQEHGWSIQELLARIERKNLKLAGRMSEIPGRPIRPRGRRAGRGVRTS